MSLTKKFQLSPLPLNTASVLQLSLCNITLLAYWVCSNIPQQTACEYSSTCSYFTFFEMYSNLSFYLESTQLLSITWVSLSLIQKRDTFLWISGTSLDNFTARIIWGTLEKPYLIITSSFLWGNRCHCRSLMSGERVDSAVCLTDSRRKFTMNF